MVFSNKGQMYRLLVNDIPVGTNTSKGTPVKALVSMAADEEPATMYSVYRDTDAKYVFFATKNGIVKKTALSEYIDTKKKSGVGAIKLREGDELASVVIMKEEPMVLTTKQGYVLRFDSKEVGTTSRMTTGVKGITLNEGDELIAALPVRNALSACRHRIVLTLPARLSVPVFSLPHHLISNASHSNDLEVRIALETVAKTRDMYVNGVGVALVIIAPDLVHQLMAGKDLTGEGCHLVKKHKLLLRKNHTFTA
jgi:DNA gyrase/topoisomerase IV subunit A